MSLELLQSGIRQQRNWLLFLLVGASIILVSTAEPRSHLEQYTMDLKGKTSNRRWIPLSLMGENESDTLFISSQASRVLISDNPHMLQTFIHLTSAVRCVKNQRAAGETCDDGNDFTFNDTWQDSGFCEGTWSIDIQGGGPCEGEAFLEYDSTNTHW